jgi:hypothetical protein
VQCSKVATPNGAGAKEHQKSGVDLNVFVNMSGLSARSECVGERWEGSKNNIRLKTQLDETVRVASEVERTKGDFR